MNDDLEDATRQLFEGWNALYSRLGLLRSYAGGAVAAPLQEDMERLLDEISSFVEVAKRVVDDAVVEAMATLQAEWGPWVQGGDESAGLGVDPEEAVTPPE